METRLGGVAAVTPRARMVAWAAGLVIACAAFAWCLTDAGAQGVPDAPELADATAIERPDSCKVNADCHFYRCAAVDGHPETLIGECIGQRVVESWLGQCDTSKGTCVAHGWPKIEAPDNIMEMAR